MKSESLTSSDRASKRMERLSSEIAKKSTSLLYVIAKELHERYPRDIRAEITAVNGLRAFRIADAIILLVEHYHWEEGRALLRSLVELVINAAYLRTAAEDEVTNYVEFDNVKTWKYAQKLEGHNGAIGDPTLRSEAKRIAEESTSRMTRDPKDISWSAYSVYQRAMEADKASGEDDFLTLTITTWNLSHNFVHSTFSSKRSCIDWLNDGTYPAGAEQSKEVASTMLQLNHALWTFCKHLNSVYDLRLDSHIEVLAGMNSAVS